MNNGIFKSIELAVHDVARRCVELARKIARVVIPGFGRRFILRMVSIAREPDRRAGILNEVRYIGGRVRYLFSRAGLRALGIRVRNLTSRVGRAVLGPFLDWLSRIALRYAVRWAPRLSAKRLARGECRTLWGVTPILTLPLKARADRLLGFESKSIVYVTYVITSQFDINLRKYYVVAAGLGLLPSFQRVVLAWHLLRCDVFNFFADRGLLDPQRRLQIDFDELRVLREAGKRVYIYAYGADVRTRQATLALGRWNFCSDCLDPPKYCTCDDDEGARYVAKLAANTTALVSLGDMLTYMPTAVHLNYWPIDFERIGLAETVERNRPLRIGHAPNHTHFKGSHYLEETISRLKERGYEIEYFKVQGVPNTQVLSLFATCDLVADQFIGGAIGYTALEAMALGRPVLSFVRTPDLVEAASECPIINTTPDTLEEALLWVLHNRGVLSAIGQQGRIYVQRWHTVDAVASRLGDLYRQTGNFPEPVLRKIDKQHEKEVSRRNSISIGEGWHHPFRVDRPVCSASSKSQSR